MNGERLFSLALLVTFTFGALTFSVLALAYWRERRWRRAGVVFPVFTIVCASAFVLNLILQLGAGATGYSAALRLVTGLVPPLMLHLVYSEESKGLRRCGTWGWGLLLFYAASLTGAVLDGLETAGLEVAAPWDTLLDVSPALMFGLAGAGGVAMQAASRREVTPRESRQRAWLRVLLLMMTGAAVMNVAWPGPLAGVAPDYLVLAFFCVSLYYRERLAFLMC